MSDDIPIVIKLTAWKTVLPDKFKTTIFIAMDQSNGVVTVAAKFLGVNVRQMWRFLDDLKKMDADLYEKVMKHHKPNPALRRSGERDVKPPKKVKAAR